MKKILLVDDNLKLAEYTRESLAAYYSVDWIHESNWTRALDEIRKISDAQWDLLVLDIHYPTDPWGGIWLFNSLVREGFRARWKQNEIICSSRVPISWDDNNTEITTLKVFMDTANIPFSRAFNNGDPDRTGLVEEVIRQLGD